MPRAARALTRVNAELSVKCLLSCTLIRRRWGPTQQGSANLWTAQYSVPSAGKLLACLAVPYLCGTGNFRGCRRQWAKESSPGALALRVSNPFGPMLLKTHGSVRCLAQRKQSAVLRRRALETWLGRLQASTVCCPPPARRGALVRRRPGPGGEPAEFYFRACSFWREHMAVSRGRQHDPRHDCPFTAPVAFEDGGDPPGGTPKLA